MTDTIREKIIAAFTTKAAALSTLPVTRAQRSIGETDAKFVSVWDGDDQTQTSRYSAQRDIFPIALEAIFKTIEHSKEANAFMGQVIKIFTAHDRTFGGLALNTEKVSAGANYPSDGSNYTTVTVIFNITYETVLGDPYTLKT